MGLLAQFGPVLQITMADDFPNVSSLFTDPLFSLKIRRARVIKNKNHGGFIDRQRKGVGMGEEENRRFFLSPSLMFSKRMKRKIERLCTGYNVLYTPLHSKVNPFKN